MSQPQAYRKHFIPLESNPEVFTQLIHTLGVSASLAFTDVYSIDDQELLAIVPRSVLALILVFPTSELHEKQMAEEDGAREDYNGCGEEEDVIWFKQTIHNACGLYGILHAVSNGEARAFIQPGSTLDSILKASISLEPQSRALVLEDSQELERAHATAAMQGDSAVPASAEDEVDYHYVCFVKSHKTGHIYEMDGDRKGPVDLGLVLSEEEDMLDEDALGIVREFIDREQGGDLNFSLMALVENFGNV